jgi:Calx-beta domain
MTIGRVGARHGHRAWLALGAACAALLMNVASAGTAAAQPRAGASTPTLTATAGAVDVAEPLTKSRVAEIPVTLNEPAPATVVLRYRLVAGSARAGVDFRNESGQLTFNKGAVGALVPVTVLADRSRPNASCWYQADAACRTFSVSLAVASGSARVASVPSVDAILWDQLSSQGVSVGDAVVASGASGADRVVRVPVTLAEPASAAASVLYTLVGGSAVANDTYVAGHGTIRFRAGATDAGVSVSIPAGHGFQPDEVLYVKLSHPAGVHLNRAVGTVIVVTGAAGVPDPISTGYRGATLTQVVAAKTRAADSYTIAASGGTVESSANAPVLSSNDRVVFWPSTEVPAADQESCATWSSQQPTQARGVTTQEGLALRVATADGVTRALTVTKDVWANANYVVNVHEWNTSWAQPFQLLASVNLGGYLASGGAVSPLPWDVCARVVGTTLQFEVWLDGQTPPAWGDTTQGATVQLGAGWDYPGAAGWYVGHLAAGASTTYTNLIDEPPQPAPST